MQIHWRLDARGQAPGKNEGRDGHRKESKLLLRFVRSMAWRFVEGWKLEGMQQARMKIGIGIERSSNICQASRGEWYRDALEAGC